MPITKKRFSSGWREQKSATARQCKLALAGYRHPAHRIIPWRGAISYLGTACRVAVRPKGARLNSQALLPREQRLGALEGILSLLVNGNGGSNPAGKGGAP